ncbi:MAG: GTP-binding protein [Planctomycetota bacterium]|nr:MAG: GTP-binding protein [Planctomycetota bacterium]
MPAQWPLLRIGGTDRGDPRSPAGGAGGATASGGHRRRRAARGAPLPERGRGGARRHPAGPAPRPGGLRVRVSRLTPPGPGGVALVRCAGPGSAAALARCFDAPRGLPPVGRVRLGTLRALDGAAVDQVLLARRGEEVFELGCHGGPAVVRAVLDALAGAARVAPPADGAGAEATDPVEAAGFAASPRVAAEVQRALPLARSERACRVLLAQGAGALDRAVGEALARCRPDPAGARAVLSALRTRGRLGRALLDPLRVALVGLPNAGKSSLFNALLGRERVLVAPEAGTTRDAIEEFVEVGGIPLRIVDTAGRREAPGGVEAAGVARAASAARAADARVVVLDATDLRPEALALAEASAPPRVVALNKIDLLGEVLPGPAVRVSARTGAGLDALGQALLTALLGPVARLDERAAVPFTPRQLGLLAGAERALARGDAVRARRCLEAVGGGSL